MGTEKPLGRPGLLIAPHGRNELTSFIARSEILGRLSHKTVITAGLYGLPAARLFPDEVPQKMFPITKPALTPNTYAYESEPMVKATGFREYDARWLFGKEINLMGIQALGMGLGALIRELGQKPESVTGHDFRG